MDPTGGGSPVTLGECQYEMRQLRERVMALENDDSLAIMGGKVADLALKLADIKKDADRATQVLFGPEGEDRGIAAKLNTLLIEIKLERERKWNRSQRIAVASILTIVLIPSLGWFVNVASTIVKEELEFKQWYDRHQELKHPSYLNPDGPGAYNNNQRQDAADKSIETGP